MNDADFGKTAQQFHRKHNAPVRTVDEPKQASPEAIKESMRQKKIEELKSGNPAKWYELHRSGKLGEYGKDASPAKVEKEAEIEDVNPETLGTELKEFFKEEAEEPEHAATDAELIPIDDVKPRDAENYRETNQQRENREHPNNPKGFTCPNCGERVAGSHYNTCENCGFRYGGSSAAASRK